MLLTLVIGCGTQPVSEKSAAAAIQAQPHQGTQTTEGGSAVENAGESQKAQIQAEVNKIDTSTPEGQAEIEQQIDQEIQELEQLLDEMEKEMMTQEDM